MDLHAASPALPAGPTTPSGDVLYFPTEDAARLEPHLPPLSSSQSQQTQTRPFVTLTFATSLDSSLSLAPGVRTVLSGPQSKAMTHYLRSRHAAILVGVGTAIADDPGLNCRISSATSNPRAIVIDPLARWSLTEESKVLQLAKAGQGLAPFIFVSDAAEVSLESKEWLQRFGGKYVFVKSFMDGGGSVRFHWEDVLAAVQGEGLDSIMVEGGGQIINSLLTPPNNRLIDSVIVTIAPTWLGQGGVVVSPPRVEGEKAAPLRLTDVSWHPLGEDVVLCGKILKI